METAERVLALYRDKYSDFNVRHFHEKLQGNRRHRAQLQLGEAGAARRGAGGAQRRSAGRIAGDRPRRPMPGMLLHIDGSKHRWFQDDRYYDLMVILDDATSEIYYAQLVEEESTRTVMAALREVIEREGLFCALYSDRASHFFVTPKAGEPVDKSRLTQVGRALKELGMQMIPAYSPQARGRSERSFGTWQSRLPQELRLAGITTLEEANRFLRERYIAEFNQKFTVKAAERGTAFRRCGRSDLDWIFSIQTERVVGKDNTVAIRDQWWQLDKIPLAAHPGRSDRDHPSASGWHGLDSLRPHMWWAVEKTEPWKTKPRFPTAPWKSPPAIPTFPPPRRFLLSLQIQGEEGSMKPNRTTNVLIKPDNYKS